MTGITPYNFEGAPVRALEINGEPWFVGKDVAEALGYTNPSKAMGDHCKGVAKRYPLQTPGGVQEVRVLSEPDVLRLIVNSTLPAAERFERWVFEDVLPSIRRTGGYDHARSHELVINVQAAKAFPAFYDVARLFGCDQNAAAISANQFVLKLSQVNLMAGLGRTHLEALSQQDQYFTPTELGKRQNLTARALNQLLLKAGFQKKHGKSWELTEAGRQFARVYDTGKRHGSGTPVAQVKWSSAVLEKIAAR